MDGYGLGPVEATVRSVKGNARRADASALATFEYEIERQTRELARMPRRGGSPRRRIELERRIAALHDLRELTAEGLGVAQGMIGDGHVAVQGALFVSEMFRTGLLEHGFDDAVEVLDDMTVRGVATLQSMFVSGMEAAHKLVVEFDPTPEPVRWTDEIAYRVKEGW